MPRGLRAVMRRHGPPSLLEMIEDEVPRPGPGEVRIEVKSAGVSPADLLICQGLHPEARRAPFTPGWDVIGRIDALGPGTSGPLGLEVAAMTIVGGFASHAVVRAEHTVPVPPGLALPEAQCMVFDWLVAYQLLHRLARLEPGQSALVQGAAGNIGDALLQLGALDGLRLYGTASARELGAVAGRGAVPIDRSTDVVAALRRHEPAGVDAVFDGVGHTLLRSARMLRRGGHALGFGHAATVMGGRRDLALFARTLGAYAAVFAGAAVGRWKASLYSVQELRKKHPDWWREDVASLFALLGAGRVAPRVAGTMPSTHAREALLEVEAGRARGKLVLLAAGPR